MLEFGGQTVPLTLSIEFHWARLQRHPRIEPFLKGVDSTGGAGSPKRVINGHTLSDCVSLEASPNDETNLARSDKASLKCPCHSVAESLLDVCLPKPKALT